MKLQRYITVIGFTVMLALNYAIYLMMPDFWDDLVYKAAFYQHFEHDAPVTWGMFADAIAYRFSFDNLRLCNVALLLLQLLPKWLSALVPTAALGLMVVYMGLFAGLKKVDCTLWALLWLLVSYCLPWFEAFYTLCFSMNYIVSGAMAAWWLYALYLNRKIGAPGIILTLILGFWHEGFALPLLCGGAVYLLMTRHDSTRLQSCLSLLWPLLPGIVYSIITALLIGKYRQYDGFTLDLLLRVAWVSKFLLVVFVAAALTAVAAKRCKIGSGDKLMLLSLLPVILASILLTMLFPDGVRELTLCYICSIMVIALIVNRWPKLRPVSNSAIGAVLYTWLAVHLAAVALFTPTLSRALKAGEQMHREIVNGCGHDGRPIAVFAPMKSASDKAWLYWRKPAGPFINYVANSQQSYFSLGTNAVAPRVSLVPEVLRSVTPQSGQSIAGSENARVIEGWMFHPATADDELMADREVTMRLGPLSKRVIINPIPFTADDGNRYTFLFVEQSYFPSFLMNVTYLGE